MKKILIMAAAMVATALGGAWALSLADAIAEVGKAIENPSSITDVVKQLAPADKTAYLAKVNEAISKLPGSADEKAGKYLQANSAAMKAMKGETLEEQILPITIFVVVSFIIVYIGGKIIIKLGRKLKSAMIVTPETE